MDGLRRILLDAPDDVLVDLLGHEGDHGCCAQADRLQRRVQRQEGVDLVLLHALCPESLSAAAHVPVGHVVHKVLKDRSGLRDLVGGKVRIRIPDHRVHPGEEPPVHDREAVIVQSVLGGIKAVDVRIQRVERVGVPQRAEELSLSLLHGLARELLGQPGSAIRVEVPADRIGAVGVQGIHRVDGIALGLRHLVAVLVEHEAHDNDVLEGRLVEQERCLRMQGVEPASCLVHSLGDEGCRELLLKQVLVLKGIVELGIRAGAGVKPAVDDLRDALHGAAAVGALDREIVHVWSVELGLKGPGIAGQLCQLLS